MPSDGQVEIEIKGDNRPLKQTLSDTTNAIDKEAKTWDKSTKQATDGMANSFGASLKKIAGAISAAAIGKKLLDFGKAAIDAASDLQEVQNVVDVTFGDASKSIDAWAKNAISQFGLTETKAKQFASTLGAMMKSAGMAEPEIVEMSENLAGLAADMASFYNLDFDTAFQKIRSGISGETEPLKQLGINMSVANLEAFALQQGLKKTFDQMSQGEQTMLRYQYLMKATADAQGDFARTSDGYANGLRLLQSNFESIKTIVGNALIPVLADAAKSLNGFLTSLTAPQKKRTVLDDFKDIDLDTESKIAEMNATVEKAKELIGVFGELDNVDAGKAMENLAKGANTLNANSPTTWSSLLNSLQKINGLENVFSGNGASDNITALANALSGATIDADKAAAWQDFLGALSNNAEALTALTGTTAEETKQWLSDIADAAGKIDPADADAWDKLLTTFVTGLPGLADTDAGKSFFDSLAQNFLAMGNESDVAKRGLAALGLSTDEINTKQAQWLETCKRLVQTIPGLSDIVNTQTGEVEGGAEAVGRYVNAWKEGREKLLLQQALYNKQKAVLDKEAELSTLQLESIMARQRRDKLESQYLSAGGNMVSQDRNPYAKAYLAAQDEYAEAERFYQESKQAIEDAKKELEEVQPIIEAMPDELGMAAEAAKQLGQAAEEAGDSMEDMARTDTIEKVEKSLKALKEYMDNVYKSTYSSLESSLGGFNKFLTPADQARAKVKDLKEELKNLKPNTKEWQDLNKEIDALEKAPPTLQNITENLLSQSKYLGEYMNNLATMKAMGYSDQVMAMVSDGSAESADYAAAMANAKSWQEVKQVNDLVAEVKGKTADLSTALTENKLAVDEAAQGLVDDWAAAMAEMNKYDVAQTNAATTVQGIADGIASKSDAVRAQVDSIIAMVDSLSNLSYGVSLPGVNGGSSWYSNKSIKLDASFYLDGKPISKSVSEYQAEDAGQLDRSGFKP